MTGSRSPIRMVGRAEELGILRDAYAEGHRGRPRVVLVRGEAGMGKTRLVQEFIAGLSPGDYPPPSVATGQCVHLGTIGTPFLPVRRLLRALRGRVGDEAFQAAAQAPGRLAALAAILPELATDDTTPPSDPGLLADAVEQLLVGLSEAQHLVLVMEDLHWADASTLDLLRTLAITDEGSHLTVICTSRTDDPESAAFTAFIGDMGARPSVTRIDLAGLPADRTAELVGLLAPGLGPAAAAQVATRSEGVPFFVEELVDVDAATLPTTLRDIVLARVARLTPEGQDVVACLSAGGDRVLHTVFEDVHPTDPAAGLREALQAHVLIAQGDSYRFRHALIQELVYNELMPGDRALLHGRYARAFQLHVDAGNDRLATAAAEHWLRAGNVERAFDATVIARAQARESLAIMGSVELGERLLALWDRVPDAAERTGMSLADLTVDILTELNVSGGDPGRALRCARDALAQLGIEDPQGRADIHRCLSAILSNAERVSEGQAELAAARALVEPLEGPRRDAAIARIMSSELISDSAVPLADAIVLVEESVRLAERSGSASALETVATHGAWALADRGDYARAAELIGTVALTARGISSQTVSTHILYWLGRYAEAEARVRETIAVAEAAGVGLSGSITFVRLNGVAAITAQGRPAEAAAALDVASACVPIHGVDRTLDWLQFERGYLALWGDAPVPLDDAVPSHLEWYPQAAAEDMARKADQLLAAAVDARSTAQRADHVTAAVVMLTPMGEEPYLTLAGLLRYGVPALARTIAAAVEAGIDEDALVPLRRALATADETLGDDPAARALRAFAAAELARSRGGSPASIVDAFRDALTVADEGFLHIRHRQMLRLGLAEALFADGEKDAAASVITEIQATAPQQGVALVARWARELAGRHGIRITHRDADAPAVGLASLTPREHEVLALVAEGLTNPAIGRRLYISPKTASVHVSAILAKIGAGNRAEAAAIYAADVAETAAR